MTDKKELISSLVLSIFDDEGPTPTVYWPDDLNESSRLLIAMKTISLLMGDSIYQDSDSSDVGINYFGILPFPDLKQNGLTYFFLIPDENARGSAKAATITVLIQEENANFFHQNMKYLTVIIDKSATKIQAAEDLKEYNEIMDSLKAELFEFVAELKDPFSTKRKIKIILVGLDKAGKTSFLHGVKKKYSEIIKALPTKGVARSEENIFSEQNSILKVWDLGGQRIYREKYFKQSELYLYNVDLLYYFIDIQASERIDESLVLFKMIIETLKDFEEYPPIIVCLNKCDPDLKDSQEIQKNIKIVSEQIKANSNNYFVKIFQTSIFTHWSLISAYSFGLSQLSPNRELFKNQLRKLSKKTNSDAVLLLNENGIILSNYSKDAMSEKVFEISAPHFQTLYKTFKEFKILKRDFLVSSGMDEKDSKKLIFKRIKVDKYNLYLLLFLDKKYTIDKVEKALPNFSKNLVELINTYI